MYICACIYIYTHTHIYMYIFVYIYTHILLLVLIRDLHNNCVNIQGIIDKILNVKEMLVCLVDQRVYMCVCVCTSLPRFHILDILTLLFLVLYARIYPYMYARILAHSSISSIRMSVLYVCMSVFVSLCWHVCTFLHVFPFLLYPV
jgi:hypothetical protein